MRGVSLGSPLPLPHCLWWLVHQSGPGPRTESPSRLRLLGSVRVYKHTWPDSPAADSNSDPCQSPLPLSSARSPSRASLVYPHAPHARSPARTSSSAWGCCCPHARTPLRHARVRRACPLCAVSAGSLGAASSPGPHASRSPPTPAALQDALSPRPAPRRPSLAPLAARPARPERGKEPPADRSGGRLPASFATATTSSLERCDARTPRACCRFRHVILGKKIKFEALSGPSACH